MRIALEANVLAYAAGGNGADRRPNPFPGIAKSLTTQLAEMS
jgi:hypothetical protein